MDEIKIRLLVSLQIVAKGKRPVDNLRPIILLLVLRKILAIRENMDAFIPNTQAAYRSLCSKDHGRKSNHVLKLLSHTTRDGYVTGFWLKSSISHYGRPQLNPHARKTASHQDHDTGCKSSSESWARHRTAIHHKYRYTARDEGIPTDWTGA